MTIKELHQKTDWPFIMQGNIDQTITGIHTGDLLSYVMGHGKAGQAWITMQTHQNIIAIASLKEFSCIILIDDNELDQQTLGLAADNEINVLKSPLDAFETIKTLVKLGF